MILVRHTTPQSTAAHTAHTYTPPTHTHPPTHAHPALPPQPAHTYTPCTYAHTPRAQTPRAHTPRAHTPRAHTPAYTCPPRAHARHRHMPHTPPPPATPPSHTTRAAALPLPPSTQPALPNRSPPPTHPYAPLSPHTVCRCKPPAPLSCTLPCPCPLTFPSVAVDLFCLLGQTGILEFSNSLRPPISNILKDWFTASVLVNILVIHRRKRDTGRGGCERVAPGECPHRENCRLRRNRRWWDVIAMMSCVCSEFCAENQR